jgi:tRNA-specific 2-thiouridylase
LFNEAGKIHVLFDEAVKGIAPGQSAVFYEGDDVIAGGIILGGRNAELI